MLSFLLLLLSVWAGPAFLAACAPVCTFHLSPLFLKMFPSLFESSRLIFFPQPSTAPSRSMPSVQSCTRCFLFFFSLSELFHFQLWQNLNIEDVFVGAVVIRRMSEWVCVHLLVESRYYVSSSLTCFLSLFLSSFPYFFNINMVFFFLLFLFFFFFF